MLKTLSFFEPPARREVFNGQERQHGSLQQFFQSLFSGSGLYRKFQPIGRPQCKKAQCRQGDGLFRHAGHFQNTRSIQHNPDRLGQADDPHFLLDNAGRFHDLKDGIYTGTADAFRGDVEVQVTVENQKVTDISILSYCDTEEYFFRAAPYVIGQMKEEQSLNIDALSGATYSSNGIIHATANALEIPEDEYAPRPGRDLAHKQKEHGHIVKHTIESQEQYEEKVKEYEDAQN